MEGDKVVIKKRGSGVALGKNIQTTNCHVTGEDKFITVIYQNDFVLSKRLMYENDKHDLCVFLVEDVSFNPISLRLISNVQGRRVLSNNVQNYGKYPLTGDQ